MTRDEAIEIERKKLQKYADKDARIGLVATANIDALIELGLLKVDEPKKKTVFQKLDDLIASKNHYGKHMTANIFSLVDQAGLKIVEADD